MSTCSCFSILRNRMLLSACLIFLVSTSGWAVILPQEDSIEAKVDAYIAPYLEMGNFSGSILIAKGDNILLSKGYGMASFELGVPSAPNTRYEIGSLGKQIVAVAILQLEEKGILKVSDPVKRYIPEFRYGDKVMIHHLLSHTSGVPELPETSLYAPGNRSLVPDDNFIERLNKLRLEFNPGSKFSYANINFMLLALLLKKVTGKSGLDYISENIFKPLGMLSTVFNDGSAIKNRAEGYVLSFGGPHNAYYFTTLTPGSFCSTVEDYFRFVRGIKNFTILSKDSVEKMFTPQDPAKQYGFAWYIATVEGQKTVFHGGISPGYRCIVSHIVEPDITVIVFSNYGNVATGKLSSDLLAMSLGKPYTIPPIRRAVELEPHYLSRCAGQYQSNSGTLVELKLENGHLYLIINSDGDSATGNMAFTYPLYPESEKSFFVKEIDAQVEIATVNLGKAEKINLIIRGKKQVLNRINLPDER